jgi:hypothetical protein
MWFVIPIPIRTRRRNPRRDPATPTTRSAPVDKTHPVLWYVVTLLLGLWAIGHWGMPSWATLPFLFVVLIGSAKLRKLGSSARPAGHQPPRRRQ